MRIRSTSTRYSRAGLVAIVTISLLATDLIATPGHVAAEAYRSCEKVEQWHIASGSPAAGEDPDAAYVPSGDVTCIDDRGYLWQVKVVTGLAKRRPANIWDVVWVQTWGPKTLGGGSAIADRWHYNDLDPSEGYDLQVEIAGKGVYRPREELTMRFQDADGWSSWTTAYLDGPRFICETASQPVAGTQEYLSCEWMDVTDQTFIYVCRDIVFSEPKTSCSQLT